MLIKFSHRQQFMAEFEVEAADLDSAAYAELNIATNKVLADSTNLANDAVRAEAQGSADLSSGNDWSGTPQDFNIAVNGGSAVAVNLTTLAADRDAVVAALNAALSAAGVTNVQAIPVGANNVGLRHTEYGADAEFVLTAGTANALATLGITADTYTGSNGTEYALTVELDSTPQAVAVAGFKAQTISLLLAEINAQLTDVVASLSAPNRIRFAATAAGAGAVTIANTGTLIPALFGGGVTIGDAVAGAEGSVGIVIKQGATPNKPTPELMYLVDVRTAAGKHKTGLISSYNRNTGILSVGDDGDTVQLVAGDVITVIGAWR